MTSTNDRLVHDPEHLNTAAWPVAANEFLTPVDRFFTRSHAPVPRIDPATWRLEVGGLVNRPRSYSLEELARGFRRHRAATTLVCAGMRRSEYLALGPLPGELPWGPEAASTGHWGGIALDDVLDAVGVAEGASHVHFLGLDCVERHGQRFGFGGSIDLDKALSGEVLLATELNESRLPAQHGFPLRAVVPGWIGARSVKWLGRITLAAEPSDNYFQSQAYRVQRETDPQDPRSVAAGVALSEVPLNAVILDPTADMVLPAGRVHVRGWAMGRGGRRVSAVEVSADDGHRWAPARIALPGSDWTWSFWEVEIELPSGLHTLAARATDIAGTTQPSTVAETWNVKGYANNAWHRISIRAE